MDYYTDRLRMARAAKNVSSAKVANVIGVSRQQYNNYENGVSDMPVKYLSKVCDYLNIDANFILCLSNDFKPCPKNNIDSNNK